MKQHQIDFDHKEKKDPLICDYRLLMIVIN